MTSLQPGNLRRPEPVTLLLCTLMLGLKQLVLLVVVMVMMLLILQ